MRGEGITWDELADIYDKITGGRARTRPMEKIFEWAEGKTDLFKVNKDGTLSFIGDKGGIK